MCQHLTILIHFKVSVTMTKGTLLVEHPPAFLASDLPGTQAVTLSSGGQDPASSTHRKGSMVEMKGARSFLLVPCPKCEPMP